LRSFSESMMLSDFFYLRRYLAPCAIAV